MSFREFLSDRELSLAHTKAFFLTLNMLLIIGIGPRNVVSSLHRSLRPYVYVYTALSAVWIGVDTAIIGKSATFGVVGSISLIATGLFFGVTFFAAKKHNPILYGAIEVLAGAAGLGILGFIENRAVPVLIFGAASSIYIVVRGLTNINEALVRRDAQLAEQAEAILADETPDDLEPWELAVDHQDVPEECEAIAREPGKLEPWEFEPIAQDAVEAPPEAPAPPFTRP